MCHETLVQDVNVFVNSSNVIPHFMRHMITYSYRDCWKLIHLSKRNPGSAIACELNILPRCTFTNGLIELSKWNTRIYENRKCTSNKTKQNKIAFIVYDYTTRFRLACFLVVRDPNFLQNWMRYVWLSSVLNQCFHARTSADEHDKLIISFIDVRFKLRYDVYCMEK